MPRIGLLSDSHGHAEVTGRAVAILAEQGAELMLHLGDLATVAVIDRLIVDAATTGPIRQSRLVFGNVDYDAEALGRYAADLGIIVDHPAGRIPLGDDRVLVFTHGDDDRLMRRAVAEQATYLCHGHLHRRRDERVCATRVINPGALSRAAEYSVAIVDTDADQVEFYPVARV